jgi:hypothetical protein
MDKIIVLEKGENHVKTGFHKEFSSCNPQIIVIGTSHSPYVPEIR